MSAPLAAFVSQCICLIFICSSLGCHRSIFWSLLVAVATLAVIDFSTSQLSTNNFLIGDPQLLSCFFLFLSQLNDTLLPLSIDEQNLNKLLASWDTYSMLLNYLTVFLLGRYETIFMSPAPSASTVCPFPRPTSSGVLNFRKCRKVSL